ncbi:hypothetical protein HDU84_002867 [Entophlyctis sp. JEL0112]|nr:hypothetical protein HDU84_002867 [Entophlyctis sp. JEL0112]
MPGRNGRSLGPKHFDQNSSLNWVFEMEPDTLESTKVVETSQPDASVPMEVDRGTYVRVPLTRTEFVLVYAGLLLAILLAALDQTIVATALRTIVNDFGHQELIPWIGSAYLLTAAPLGTLYGKFADIFGRKWVFVFAITIFETGSLICAVSNSMVVLIVGRAVAGIGGGGIFALVLIIISDIVSIRDRGKYQGLIGATFGLASVIAPLLGGAFSDNGLWRWCFFINLPLGAITLMTVIVFLKFPSEEGSIIEKIRRIDFVGASLLFAAILCLVTPLQLGGSVWDWNSAQVIAMLILSAVLFALFSYVEIKFAKEPVVPPSIFINVSVPVLFVISICVGAAFLSGVYYLSLFFQVVYGDTATQGGLALVPFVFGLVISSVSSGLVVSKYGKYVLFFYAGPLIIAAGITATSFLDSSSVLIEQIAFLFIFGIGVGCLIQTRVLALQSIVPLQMIAISTAVLQTCNTLGSTIGISITGTIFNNVVAANIANKEELQQFISQFNARGFSVGQADVAEILSLLAAAVPYYPKNNETLAAIYNATLATAKSQLIDGFTGAYKIAYLCLLPYTAVILLLAVFVKQVDLGGQRGKVAETVATEAA